MSKQTMTTIKPLTAGAAPFQLAAAYGTPAGVGDLLEIAAYSDAGEAQKNQFLADGAKLLRAVGQALYAYGFREVDVRTNRAGIAVSGDVMAEYRLPEGARWVSLSLGSTGCRFLAPGRRDGVAIVARWRQASGKHVTDGPNTWIDASLSSFDLAHRLVRLVGLTPQPALLPLPAPKPARGSRSTARALQPASLGSWVLDLEQQLQASLDTRHAPTPEAEPAPVAEPDAPVTRTRSGAVQHAFAF